MPDHSIRRASDLAGDERLIVERWLGRAVSNEETISIQGISSACRPGDLKRQRLRHDIVGKAHEIGSGAGDVRDRELDELLGEAFAIHSR
jgi:hypothetical protein